MGEDDRPAPSRRPLSDDDITSVQRVGRRTILTLAGGAAFAAVVAAEPVSAQTSDSDSGPKADPAGRGWRQRTGQSDSDSSATACTIITRQASRRTSVRSTMRARIRRPAKPEPPVALTSSPAPAVPSNGCASVT